MCSIHERTHTRLHTNAQGVKYRCAGGTQVRKREQILFLSPQTKLQGTSEAVVAPPKWHIIFAHCSHIHITAALGREWVKVGFLPKRQEY